MHNFLKGTFRKASPRIIKVLVKLFPMFFLVTGTRFFSFNEDLLLIKIAGITARSVQVIPTIIDNCLDPDAGSAKTEGS